jgi:IS5 family transposase
MKTTFLTIAHDKKLRCEKFLNEMGKVIPWYKLLEEINKVRKRSNLGRDSYDDKLMLRIYFLQQWYNLSDPAMEEAIYDRMSFQKFLDIDILGDSIPDETTILNFRHFLEKYQLQKKFFEIVNKRLKKKRLIMKEGTIVDATIISAPSSTKNNSGERDPEMSSTEKNGNWHFGMKAHIGVDSKNGIVHSIEGTTAKVSDKKMLEELQHGDEKVICGDKGYYDQNLKRECRRKNKIWAILDRGTRNHPLSNSQKKKNKKLSSLRAKVEHPFQVLKCQWGYTKVRYKGLFKNTMQLYTLFSLINLYRMRKKLI